MSNDFWSKRVREGAVLSPIDRIAEVLFGLIMVLTFTGAISVATGRNDVREMLWAALGCNVAWGIVDAVMYLMNLLLERGHGLTVINRIRKSGDQTAARGIFKDEVQPLVASLLSDEEVNQLNDRIKKLPEPKVSQILSVKDFISALQIFLLVFICTFPVALPFALIHELGVAMRVSNGIALVMLFIGGYQLAGYAGFRPWLTAMVYTVIGVLMVGLTMALGG